MSRIIRLYTDNDLGSNQTVSLTKKQVHYMRNVLRREIGDPIHFFNGRDGQWAGEITALSKNNGEVTLTSHVKPQQPNTDLWVLCAPIKKDRFDFCLEKTVELGASDFMPIYTEFTDIKRANIERLSQNAIEAAQQCEATSLVTVHDAQSLNVVLDQWDTSRVLYICAERGKAPAFINALNKQTASKAAILIGPEGGFSDKELDLLSSHANVQPIHLGPLILRTETALAAAITLYQSIKGNWADYQR